MNRTRHNRLALNENAPSEALGKSLVGLLPWVFLTVVAGAGLLIGGLMVMAVSFAGETIAREGARAMVIRAVLKADVDPVQANELAERIRLQVPDVELEVITETMGRALMALQEPWVARMPDFEVTPLPVLIELHHPELLTNTAQVQQFVRQLDNEREVDFVAYNETAHTRLVALAGSINHLRSHGAGWVLILLSVAGFATVVLFASRAAMVVSWGGIFLLSAVAWFVVFTLTWPVFRLWERPLIRDEAFVALPASMILQAGGVSLVIILIASICGGLLGRWR